MIDVATRRRATVSPLRYPGGKAALAGFLGDVVDGLGLDRPTYIEPYAGGAGAGLDLLYSGSVDRIVINDLDRSIYSLWVSMVTYTDDFLKRLERVPLTVDEWKNQREIYRERDDPNTDPRDLGFAAFYLNRANRSGVLNAGVVGGLKQEGTYKIDARFNKTTLKQRIEKLAEHRSRIWVTRQDGARLLKHWLQKKNVLAYVDPPYYDKGSFLYLNSFVDAQHQALADVLNSRPASHWVLTYDNVDAIAKMYTARSRLLYDLNYSAHKREVASELMVLSDTVAPLLSGHGDP